MRPPSKAWDDEAFVVMAASYCCDCCGSGFPGKYAERFYDAGVESFRSLVRELVDHLAKVERGMHPVHLFHDCHDVRVGLKRTPMPDDQCQCGYEQLIARAKAALGEQP